jgi:hypothetical protein
MVNARRGGEQPWGSAARLIPQPQNVPLRSEIGVWPHAIQVAQPGRARRKILSFLREFMESGPILFIVST